MKTVKNYIKISLMLASFNLLFFISASDIYPASAYSLNEKGNKAFAEKKYDEALKNYIDAQVKDPNSNLLTYNIGAVYMKQKKYDEAIEKFNKTASQSNDKSLNADSFYNIGVAQFRQAEQIEATGKLSEAAKKLEESMASFRQALKFNPSDMDSKYNHEQAKRKWKELLDKIKEQQKQQQGDNKQQQDQNQQQQQQNQQQQQAKGEDKKEGEQDKQQAGNDKEQQQEKHEKQMAEAQKDEQKDEQNSAEEKQAEVKKGELSKDDIERILNQLPDDNKDNYKKIMRGNQNRDYMREKDW